MWNIRTLSAFIVVVTFSVPAYSSALETQECSLMTLPSGMRLHCPDPKEPEKTDCCYDKETPVCCLMDKEGQKLVMIVALSVISSCFILTVLVIVCCFCPKCLLYDACRAKYTRGEIIAYTKEEEMALNSTMPYEDQTEKSSYSTQTIKIKPIADV
ncbi:uncharacterized protein LOC117640973 [Thrips palmi]|uniref:Uncharacterized protein LOC117640973 n=1 Tax=Thrips palmi TaxID=161013 RepID=A0A6P8YB09_THRPL|nr:uncharacterized protein LOC117640973 [Thrips palmi]